MCANKSDIHFAGSENNNGNKSIIIAFDVEYIPIIANIVNRVESLFYIC